MAKVTKADTVDYLQGVASYIDNLVDTYYETLELRWADARSLQAWVDENVATLQTVFNYCGNGTVERL